jgi:hypothetical protein
MKRRSVQPSLARRAARILRKLKNVPGLSIEEKSVHALGLAATPEERWELFENFVRSAGYWQPLKKRNRIRKSKAAVGLDKDKLHLRLIAEFLRCRRAIRE